MSLFLGKLSLEADGLMRKGLSGAGAVCYSVDAVNNFFELVQETGLIPPDSPSNTTSSSYGYGTGDGYGYGHGYRPNQNPT